MNGGDRLAWARECDALPRQPGQAAFNEGDRSSAGRAADIPVRITCPNRAAGTGLSKPTVAGSNPAGLPMQEMDQPRRPLPLLARRRADG